MKVCNWCYGHGDTPKCPNCGKVRESSKPPANTSAVIEAEPEVEALQDGGTCCICDNPITGYDGYGISDKQQHRYHWHCVRREAATVSSPTSGAETAKLRELLTVAKCPACDGSGAIQIAIRERSFRG